MPKEITHCILAERAVHSMAASSSPRKQATGAEIYFLYEKHPELLYFGSVAPDIFFYDIKLPWEIGVKHRGLAWGELIHGTHGEDSLAHIFEIFKILKDPEAQAIVRGRSFSDGEKQGILLFALGYLTHVALDTIMHPIVYYFAGDYYARDRSEKLRAEARHRAIETILDLYNLESIGSDLGRYKAMRKMALPREWRDLVLGVYTLSLLQAWPEKSRELFGDSGAKPGSIRLHPLFKAAARGYKKQILFNKIFQNSGLARSGLWYNRRKKDKLHFNSSLLYPARSYREYERRHPESHFRITDINTYSDPLDNRTRAVRPGALRRRSLARSHAFLRTAWLFAHGSIDEKAARRVLKGYSLNNGRVGVPTGDMKFFAPLAIDGNFRYLNLEGVIV